MDKSHALLLAFRSCAGNYTQSLTLEITSTFKDNKSGSMKSLPQKGLAKKSLAKKSSTKRISVKKNPSKNTTKAASKKLKLAKKPKATKETLKSLTKASAIPTKLVSLKSKVADPHNALRKHLDERLRSLYNRTAILEKELVELSDNKFYRTCIFGSARIKADTKLYKDVSNLARYLAWEGIDVLTGGGPGLMEAANQGAAFGKQERKTRSMSYGLSIELPFEPDANMHLDVKRHHHKFSSRLDDFMRLSHSVIVTPGGIGTVLELFFAWQLIQVKHIETRPIVLLDTEFWNGLFNWMNDFPLGTKLVSPGDFSMIKMVDTPEEAAELIIADHRHFRTKTSTKART